MNRTRAWLAWHGDDDGQNGSAPVHAEHGLIGAHGGKVEGQGFHVRPCLYLHPGTGGFAFAREETVVRVPIADEDKLPRIELMRDEPDPVSAGLDLLLHDGDRRGKFDPRCPVRARCPHHVPVYDAPVELRPLATGRS